MKKNNKFQEFFLTYLLEILTEKKDKLTIDETKKIFLFSLRDYFNKKIDISIISSVATQLFYQLNKPTNLYKTTVGHKLGNVLDSASELDYYSKNKKNNKHNQKLYLLTTKELKSYYLENKHLIENNK